MYSAESDAQKALGVEGARKRTRLDSILPIDDFISTLYSLRYVLNMNLYFLRKRSNTV